MIYSITWDRLHALNIPIRFGHADFATTYKNHAIYKYQIPLAGQHINLKKEFAKIIKESENDSFVFILTRVMHQYAHFQLWIKEYELEDYIMLDFKPGISNPNYTSISTYGESTVGNLQLVVMASKNHDHRDKFVLTEPILKDL